MAGNLKIRTDLERRGSTVHLEYKTCALHCFRLNANKNVNRLELNANKKVNRLELNANKNVYRLELNAYS